MQGLKYQDSCCYFCSEEMLGCEETLESKELGSRMHRSCLEEILVRDITNRDARLAARELGISVPVPVVKYSFSANGKKEKSEQLSLPLV